MSAPPDPVTGIIEELRPGRADPTRRSIRVDGRTVAVLPAAAVDELGLEVGAAWTAERAARVEHWRARAAARRIALHLLGRRAYATRALAEALERRGIDGSLAAEVVAGLVDDGWLDDRTFADDVARSARAKGVTSAPLLARTMIARGVDPDIAETAAADAVADADPAAAAADLARRRLNGRTDRASAARVGRWLARRGYDEDIIHGALARAGAPLEPGADA